MAVKIYDSVAGVWSYAENHALERETAVQRDARARMRDAGIRPCLASQAAFLAHEAQAMGAKSVILLGGAPIMEAVYLAGALGEDGQVTIIDTDKQVIALATAILRPMESKGPVKLRIINLGTNIYFPRLNSQDYDMLVASGGPENHQSAYASAPRLLRHGGELVLTDVMALLTEDSKGGVPNAADRGDKAVAMRALIKDLDADGRFSTALFPVATGMMIGTVK